MARIQMTTRPLFFHIDTGSFGGGSKMLLRLLTSLPDEFDPILLAQKDGELPFRANSQGIDVEIIPFRPPLDTYDHGLFSLPFWKKAAACLRILQFNLEARRALADADVIWCQNLRAVLTLAPLSTIFRKPVIWNVGLGMESEEVVTYLNEFAFRVCDYVFIESTDQADQLFTDTQRQRFEEKFVTFHKGIDTDEFDPRAAEPNLSGSALKVGTAASLVPRKGLDVFVEAAAKVDDKLENDVQFYIAGTVPETRNSCYAERMKELIKRHDLSDRFTLLGWVEDMPAYLKSLDVFVHPSNAEGIPGAVREAMAMEVPVVATDVGGTADAVADGEVGYLVPPRDPDALAMAIRTLLDDEEVRREMGTKGRRRVLRQFSIEQYVAKYSRFLRKVATT